MRVQGELYCKSVYLIIVLIYNTFMVNKTCNICSRSFKVDNYRRLSAKFCSIICRSKWQSQNIVLNKHPGWKGGRIRHSEGYMLIKQPNHPFANKGGYLPEHRLILEKLLGKFIDPQKFHVHHIDGVKTNNSTNNLLLLSPLEHYRIEKGWKIIDGIWWKTCGFCKRFLKTEGNFYKRTTGQYVSQCIECCALIYEQKKEKQKWLLRKKKFATTAT